MVKLWIPALLSLTPVAMPPNPAPTMTIRGVPDEPKRPLAEPKRPLVKR